MSNTLAIATVTASLQRLLHASASLEIQGVNVKIGRPRAPTNNDTTPEINICLYQVLPNIGYQNCDLPSKDRDGQWLRKPQIALNLYYLLSFYGDEQKIIPQQLLGNVVSTLHTQAILDTDLIQQTIENPPFDFLIGSDLASQVEKIKITPLNFGLEEASKLWSVFFQTPYSLSVAYQASVVLIEADVPIILPPDVQEVEVKSLPVKDKANKALKARKGMAPLNKPKKVELVE